MPSEQSVVQTITVLVVDDHPLLREGVASALAGEPDMRVIAEAANGQSAIEQFRKHRPDVTLMDLQLPGMSGLEAMRVIRDEFPDACVLVLTTYRGDVQVINALRGGAKGFLLKDTLRKELRAAIRAVHAGQRVIPPDVARQLAEHVADEMLSPRELDVLRLAALGNSNKRIAAALGVSEDTVKAHMKHILAKLDARDRTHAVVTALERGIITL